MSRYLLTCFLLLSACVPPEIIYPSKDLTRVEIFHVEELKRRYDIRLDRASTIYNPEIGRLVLEYTSEELFDLCHARNLLVDLVDSLLEKVNTDAYLAGQLSYYPLNYQDVDLLITFDSFFGQFCDLQYVNQIRMSSSHVTYYAFSAFQCDTNYFEMHNEPYETAQANSYYLRRAQEIYAKPEEIAEIAPMMTPPKQGIANEPFTETALGVEASRPSMPVVYPNSEGLVLDLDETSFYNGGSFPDIYPEPACEKGEKNSQPTEELSSSFLLNNGL